MGHVLGRVDAADRRGDHDARRRQRAGAAAGAGAVPGGHRADWTRELARDGPAARARDQRPSWSPPAFASRSTTATSVRAGSSRNGSCAACRSGSKSGPRTSRNHKWCWRVVIPARRPAWRWLAWSIGCAVCSTTSSAICSSAPGTFREEHTQRVATYEEFKAVLEGRPGFVIANWCGAADCEAQVKADTQATIRNMPLDAAPPHGTVHPLRPSGGCRSVVREVLLRPAVPADRRLRAGQNSCSRSGQRFSILLARAWRRVMPSRATMAWNASERCRCHQSEPVGVRRTGPEVRRGQRFEARGVADHRHRGEKFDRQRLGGRFERLSQVVDAESAAASGERNVDRCACAHPFAPLLSFSGRLPLTNGLDQSMQRGQAQRVTVDRHVTAHGFGSSGSGDDWGCSSQSLSSA